MFRFTIRDLLWLTVVAALLAAWWIDSRQQAARNYRAEMQSWRFRAESLQHHVQRASKGKVVFRKTSGHEEVLVHDATGMNSYFN